MKNIKTLRKVSPGALDKKIIQVAAELIQQGGVVLFPTRCLYGLGADALSREAVDKVFEIKNRPFNNPILVLIHHHDLLSQVVKQVPPAAQKIMNRFWPGGVTIVMEALDRLPANLTAGTGKIGVRQPGHPVASALAQVVGMPITGTSANLSGEPGCSNINELDSRVAEQVDLIIDSGPLKGGKGSTVVDVTVDPVKVLREGVVSREEIFKLIAS